MPAAIEVEDIPPLLRAVARFAEAVEKLKDVVLEGKARCTVCKCNGWENKIWLSYFDSPIIFLMNIQHNWLFLRTLRSLIYKYFP